LPTERLARRHVDVHLHPRTPDRLEVPSSHVPLDTLEQIGVQLLDPLILLSLSSRESMLRVSVDQVALRRPGPRGLLLSHLDGPQPGSVDVAGC
jgi:hypothetical protein